MFKEIFKPKEKKPEIEEKEQEFEGSPHPETPQELEEAKIAAGVTSAKEAKKRREKGDKLIKKIAESASLLDALKAEKKFEESVGQHPAWQIGKHKPLEVDKIIDELKKRRELITKKMEPDARIEVKPIEPEVLTPEVLTEEEYKREIFIKDVQEHFKKLEDVGEYFSELICVKEAIKELDEAKKMAGVKTHEDVMIRLLEESGEVISRIIEKNDISFAKRVLENARNLVNEFGTPKLIDRLVEVQKHLPPEKEAPLSDSVKGLINAGKFDEAEEILNEIEKK